MSSVEEQQEWLKTNEIPQIVDKTIQKLLEKRPEDPFSTMIAELTALRPQYAAKACEAKMTAAGISKPCIQGFLQQQALVARGETGTIPEADISAVTSLKEFKDLPIASSQDGAEPLRHTVVMKLNGGLGTSMGLEKAKSLLKVKNTDSFLDIMAKQVMHLRATYKNDVLFMLMNSFSTSDDTKAHMAQYPEFSAAKYQEVELMQNKVPKILQDTLYPASFPADREKEWCPPGHGDIYAALLGSGKLQSLVEKGYKYMFVSNSDNLGATLDLNLLTYFAKSDIAFCMEVCERGESDKKGGHLAKSKATSGLLLREAAQCAKEDEPEFQNITKHKYFNTNNLWINLVVLKATMEKQGGVMPLPVIRNAKTVDPTNASSAKVFQLETAMGAAISAFGSAATALVVPRDRFSPVKTCNDLFSLRSDAYTLTEDFRVVLCPERKGVAPLIDLDGKLYKFVDDMDKTIPEGAPSLKDCDKLVVSGLVAFKAGVVIQGRVTFTNKDASTRKQIVAGTYKDQDVTL